MFVHAALLAPIKDPFSDVVVGVELPVRLRRSAVLVAIAAHPVGVVGAAVAIAAVVAPLD